MRSVATLRWEERMRTMHMLLARSSQNLSQGHTPLLSIDRLPYRDQLERERVRAPNQIPIIALHRALHPQVTRHILELVEHHLRLLARACLVEHLQEELVRDTAPTVVAVAHQGQEVAQRHKQSVRDFLLRTQE